MYINPKFERAKPCIPANADAHSTCSRATRLCTFMFLFGKASAVRIVLPKLVAVRGPASEPALCFNTNRFANHTFSFVGVIVHLNHCIARPGEHACMRINSRACMLCAGTRVSACSRMSEAP